MINKRKLQSLIYQLFCMFVGLAVISPIIYCVLVSFMQPSEILTKEVHLIPDYIYLVNYIKAVTQTDIFRFMLNSFIVAFVSSVVRSLPPAARPIPSHFLSIRERSFYFISPSVP